MAGPIQVPQALELWGQQQRRYLRNQDQDLWLPVTGPVGTGKSTLMLLLAPALDPTFYDQHIKHRMAWRAKELLRLLDTLGPYKAVILDESSRGLWRREGMTRENRETLVSIYEDRKYNHIKLLAFPDFSELDPDFAEHRPEYRIELRDKGHAAMLKAKRKTSGRIVAWKELFTFTFPSLEGTQVWKEYVRLAKERTRHSRHEDTSSTPSQPEALNLAKTYQNALAPKLARRWRTQASTDDS